MTYLVIIRCHFIGRRVVVIEGGGHFAGVTAGHSGRQIEGGLGQSGQHCVNQRKDIADTRHRERRFEFSVERQTLFAGGSKSEQVTDWENRKKK